MRLAIGGDQPQLRYLADGGGAVQRCHRDGVLVGIHQRHVTGATVLGGQGRGHGDPGRGRRMGGRRGDRSLHDLAGRRRLYCFRRRAHVEQSEHAHRCSSQAADAGPAPEPHVVPQGHCRRIGADRRRRRHRAQGRIEAQRLAHTCPHVIRWGLGNDFFQQRRQQFLPLPHGLGELAVGGNALCGRQAFFYAQRAEHVFAGKHVARRFLVDGQGRAHRSRHALSLARPRRIQLLIVPIGVSVRAASSS